MLGLRIGGQLSFFNQWHLISALSFERRDNDENHPFFLKQRQDKQYDALLGLNYILVRNLSIKSLIGYTKNDANLDLYNYNRTVVSFNLRKEFNWYSAK